MKIELARIEQCKNEDELLANTVGYIQLHRHSYLGEGTGFQLYNSAAVQCSVLVILIRETAHKDQA